MYEPCMCGAPDCRYCFPGNFQRINGKSVYTAEMTDEEIEAVKDDFVEPDTD